jgi:hypothetical protein
MNKNTPIIVGAAAAEITVSVPVDLAGYALRSGPARSVGDPLNVRTTVLRTPEAAIAIAVLDLLYIPARLAELVRRATAQTADIDPEAILVAATHTHAGPAGLATTDTFDSAIQAASREATVRATASSEPARLVSATRTIAGISANRRHLGGPTDRLARILIAKPVADPTRTIATIVNFPCHATVLDHEWNQVSADFPGVACATIEGLVGGTATYLQGFAGDINPARARRGRSECDRIGRVIGSTVSATVLQSEGMCLGLMVESPTHQEEFDVTTASACVEVRPRLAVAWAPVAVGPKRRPIPLAGPERSAAQRSESWITELLDKKPNLFGVLDPGPPGEIRVQLLTLADDLHIVGVPGEPFGASAATLRAATKGDLLAAGYANQSVGYLPPADEWDLGGYEVGCCFYDVQTESAITAAALRLIRQESP